MVSLEEVGKFLVKVGGVLVLVLGLLGVVKYAVYLILIPLVKGALDLLSSWIPVLSVLSTAAGLMAALGSVITVALLVLNAVFAYFGYRLLKAADEIPMPAEARDRWVVTMAVLLALALFAGSPLIAAATLVPIAGLVISPVRRAPPAAQ